MFGTRCILRGSFLACISYFNFICGVFSGCLGAKCYRKSFSLHFKAWCMLKYFLIKMSSIFYYLRCFFGVYFFIFFTHRPLQLFFCSIRKKLFQLKSSQFVVAVFQSGNSRKTIEAIIAKRWKTDVRLKYAN